jgi:hypothetical protein
MHSHCNCKSSDLTTIYFWKIFVSLGHLIKGKGDKMNQAFIFSLRIIFCGILLPFRIWQFSKEKLISKSDNNSVKSLLDEDYIVTSWFDWMIDAIIFLSYPIGLFVVTKAPTITPITTTNKPMGYDKNIIASIIQSNQLVTI